jgi:endonuclease/exonuclease/phosphatase family metal-dependent hydrolase
MTKAFYKMLSILTWNIWNDPSPNRYPIIINIIRQLSPDVVCLQEITSDFLEYMEKNLQEYTITKPPSMFDKSYYNIGILTKLSPTSSNYVRFQSTNMGRGILLIELDKVCIATVHLESSEMFTNTRIKQLRECFHILNAHPNCILVGDFNFGDGAPENSEIQSGYMDIWNELHSVEDGHTMPSNGYYPSNRIDRMVVKKSLLQPQSICKVGTQPVNGLIPSDHYGLFGEFSLNGQMLL